MKVYIFYKDAYPYLIEEIMGVFLNKKDAEDMHDSMKSEKDDYDIHEAEVIG
jgi:hypothetical protein